MSSQQFYSEEEAQRILSFAARDVTQNGMSREELVRAAGEMGIAPEAIARAEEEIRKQQEIARREQEEKELRAQFRRYMRGRIMQDLGGIFTGAIALTAVWLFTGAGYFWPIWVLPWMGLGAIHTIKESFFCPNSYEQRYERWLAKRNGGPGVPPPPIGYDARWDRRQRRLDKVAEREARRDW